MCTRELCRGVTSVSACVVTVCGGQFEAIRRYVVEQGGSVLIMAAEGGEAKSGTNVNYLLEE